MFRGFLSLATLMAITCLGLPQSYHFKFDPERSFTKGNLRIEFKTIGTFTGTYDPVSNPEGAYVSPLNELIKPVNGDYWIPCQPVWEWSKSGTLTTAGSFDLQVDLGARKAQVTHYQAERISLGPTEVFSKCIFNNEACKFSNPNLAIEPNQMATALNRVTLDRIRVTQAPGFRSGPITELSDGWMRVSIPFMAQVLLDPLDFGQSKPIVVPMAVSLVGDFKITDQGPIFAYIVGEGGDNWTREVDMTLEQQIANYSTKENANIGLRLNTVLKRVTLNINGIRQLYAVGTLIKEN